jgi:hypothetical protein
MISSHFNRCRRLASGNQSCPATAGKYCPMLVQFKAIVMQSNFYMHQQVSPK